MKGWAKWAVVAGMSAFALAAAKVAPVVVGYIGGREAVRWLTNDGPPSVSELESALSKQGFTFYAVIKAELPEEYPALMSSVISTMEGEADETIAQQKGMALLADLRRRHARSLLAAPDDALSAALYGQLDVLELVQRRETYQICNQVAASGPAVLGATDRQYHLAFNGAAISLFRAIGAGRRNAVKVEPASDDDWAEVGTKFLEMGATEEQSQALQTNDMTSPNYCPATILALKAVLDLRGPIGRRVRADMAYNIAKG